MLFVQNARNPVVLLSCYVAECGGVFDSKPPCPLRTSTTSYQAPTCRVSPWSTCWTRSSRRYRSLWMTSSPSRWSVLVYSCCRGYGLSTRATGGASCSLSRFPFVRVRPVIRYFSATFVIFSTACSLLLAFSFHLSSPCAFPGSLFTQSSHLSFLQPPRFFVSEIFLFISRFSFWPCVQPSWSDSELFYQLWKPQFHFILLCLALFFSPLYTGNSLYLLWSAVAQW